MQCPRRSGIDSARAPSEQGANKTTIPLDPSDPGSLATLDKAWRVSDDKGVRRPRNLKVEIPAEVFLARLGVSIYFSVPKLVDQPFRYVVTETASIDEVSL